MFICFNLKICRSERDFTEMMMPAREGRVVVQQLALILCCGGGGDHVDIRGQLVGVNSLLSSCGP